MKEQAKQPTEVDNILKDKAFQKILAHIATEKGDSIAQVCNEAEGYLKELYTEHQQIGRASCRERV